MDAAMNANAVQVVGKADIIYSDLVVDPSVAVVASETHAKTDVEQLINGVIAPDYKWFAFRENKLDGSCHFIPQDKSNEIGWWSARASDSIGAFDPPIEISITFNPKAVGTISVIGDVELQNYPKDFDVELYDGVTLLYTLTVTGNTQASYLAEIPNQFHVTEMKLIIHSINRALVTSKLLEFYKAVKVTYTNDQIVSMNILEEIYYDTAGVPLGAVSSNELDLVLDNFDSQLTPGNPDSVIQAYLKKYRLVLPYIGVMVNGSPRWYSMGKFWTVSWKPDEDAKTMSLTAFDRMELLNNTEFTTSTVYTNKTATELFTMVLENAGLNASEFVIANTFDNITIPYAWFERMSHRKALQSLAEAFAAFIYVDRTSKIHITRVTPTAQPTIVFDDDTNVMTKVHPSTLMETTNYVEVEAKLPTLVTNESVYTSEESITVPAGQSIQLECVFSTTPVTAITANTITGAPNTTITATTLYCWGALITLTNSAGGPQTITKLELVGTIVKQSASVLKIAKDDESITNDGKSMTSVSHRFIQSSTQAQTLADYLLNTYKNSRRSVVLETLGDASILLEDRMAVTDHETNVVEEYTVIRQNFNFDGTLGVQVTGRYLEVRTTTHQYLSTLTHADLNNYTHQELEGGI